MLTYQPAKVLHIYANSTDQWGGRPLYSAIIQKCLQLGVAGATGRSAASRGTGPTTSCTRPGC